MRGNCWCRMNMSLGHRRPPVLDAVRDYVGGTDGSIVRGERPRIWKSGEPIQRFRSRTCRARSGGWPANGKRWRDARMALRWAAAGMIEAQAGFRRLKAHRQLPALRWALAERQPRHSESTPWDRAGQHKSVSAYSCLPRSMAGSSRDQRVRWPDLGRDRSRLSQEV